MKHIITIFFIFLSLPAIAEKYCVFTPIKGTEGLGGNRVRNITQLPDGRMMNKNAILTLVRIWVIVPYWSMRYGIAG